MRFSELKTELSRSKDSLADLYIIRGEDEWLKAHALKGFKALVGTENLDFNFLVFDFEDSMSDVVEALNTQSFFDDFKVVAVKGVQDKLGEVDRIKLEKYLSAPNPDAVLLLICESTPPRIKSEAKVETIDCDHLQGLEMSAVIKEMLSSPPAREMDGDGERELIKRTLGDLNVISMEIEKLKAYSEERITLSDVCELTVPEIEFQIFELSSAVGNKEGERSLEVLDNLFKQGLKGVAILNMLYGQYRRMLHAELHKNHEDKELASLLKVKPGALYHLRRAGKNYTQQRLKKCVDYLHEMSYLVVQGKRNERTAVQDAVITLLNM
jgi:DNA polymerase III delta subunit